ncbi:unnamed protein product [Hymenolepis diminuta]|uniref:Uncharacterized protein n=1 Tax=Hymenolepis diminuta TaxID=6216 RepID=A0A564YWV4_HYMDI|nr:unnamed protein product [Hymenolepis diminuta]
MLAAGKGSPIKTFGRKSATLDFGLRRKFRRIIIIANASKLIIGTDFVCHFDLLLDLSRIKLLEPLTNFHSKCTKYLNLKYCSITFIQFS